MRCRALLNHSINYISSGGSHPLLIRNFMIASWFAYDHSYQKSFFVTAGAAVCSFIAVVDDRVIHGVVKRTDEAEKEYDDAMRMGQSAFLVEEKLPDVFKAKIGNLAPGSGAKIRLTYVTELKGTR